MKIVALTKADASNFLSCGAELRRRGLAVPAPVSAKLLLVSKRWNHIIVHSGQLHSSIVVVLQDNAIMNWSDVQRQIERSSAERISLIIDQLGSSMPEQSFPFVDSQYYHPDVTRYCDWVFPRVDKRVKSLTFLLDAVLLDCLLRCPKTSWEVLEHAVGLAPVNSGIDFGVDFSCAPVWEASNLKTLIYAGGSEPMTGAAIVDGAMVRWSQLTHVELWSTLNDTRIPEFSRRILQLCPNLAVFRGAITELGQLNSKELTFLCHTGLRTLSIAYIPCSDGSAPFFDKVLCPNLRELDVQFQDDTHNPVFLVPFIATHPRLSTLKLTGCPIPHSTLARILEGVPMLQELVMDWRRWEDWRSRDEPYANIWNDRRYQEWVGPDGCHGGHICTKVHLCDKVLDQLAGLRELRQLTVIAAGFSSAGLINWASGRLHRSELVLTLPLLLADPDKLGSLKTALWEGSRTALVATSIIEPAPNDPPSWLVRLRDDWIERLVWRLAWPDRRGTVIDGWGPQPASATDKVNDVNVDGSNVDGLTEDGWSDASYAEGWDGRSAAQGWEDGSANGDTIDARPHVKVYFWVCNFCQAHGVAMAAFVFFASFILSL